MKIIKPDIITNKTKVIELGHLENKLVEIECNLIEENKKSNSSLKSGYWIQLNGGIYYFKVPTFTQGYLNELLGEKISLEFGLESVHYQLAEAIIYINGIETKVYGLLSKLAIKPGYSYQKLKNIICDETSKTVSMLLDSSNLSILSHIDSIYQGQPICRQMRLLIAREFFTQEVDRIESEILLATKDNQTELGYLTDYEYEWLDIKSQYSLLGLLKLDLADSEIIGTIKQDSFFQEAFIKSLQINVPKLLEQIIEKHKIRLISYDKNNYDEKSELVKTLIRRKRLII